MLPLYHQSEAAITRSAIIDNSGGNGGGIHALGGTLKGLYDSTLAGNVADNFDVEGRGGGIHAIDSRLTVVNSTVTGNAR